MLEFKPLNNVFPTYHNMIIQNILCSILTPYPFIHPSLQVLHKWIHRWNQYWGFLGGTGKTETNRIKLSKGYFYHKAQNSWEDKKKKTTKICNTSLPFYPSKRIRNPPELKLQLVGMLSLAMTPAQDIPILPLPSNCFQACLHSTAYQIC